MPSESLCGTRDVRLCKVVLLKARIRVIHFFHYLTISIDRNGINILLYI